MKINLRQVLTLQDFEEQYYKEFDNNKPENINIYIQRVGFEFLEYLFQQLKTPQSNEIYEKVKITKVFLPKYGYLNIKY